MRRADTGLPPAIGTITITRTMIVGPTPGTIPEAQGIPRRNGTLGPGGMMRRIDTYLDIPGTIGEIDRMIVDPVGMNGSESEIDIVVGIRILIDTVTPVDPVRVLIHMVDPLGRYLLSLSFVRGGREGGKLRIRVIPRGHVDPFSPPLTFPPVYLVVIPRSLDPNPQRQILVLGNIERYL